MKEQTNHQSTERTVQTHTKAIRNLSISATAIDNKNNNEYLVNKNIYILYFFAWALSSVYSFWSWALWCGIICLCLRNVLIPIQTISVYSARVRLLCHCLGNCELFQCLWCWPGNYIFVRHFSPNEWHNVIDWNVNMQCLEFGSQRQASHRRQVPFGWRTKQWSNSDYSMLKYIWNAIPMDV